MKKFLTVLFTILLLFTFAACSDDDTGGTGESSSSSVSSDGSTSSGFSDSSGSSSNSSSSSVPAVSLPFYTDSFYDFESNNWSVNAAGSYYSTYLKFTSEGQTAISPKFTAGAGKIAFDLISGASGPVYGMKLYGSVDGSSFTLLGTFATPGGGSASTHQVTPANAPDLADYQYVKFEMGTNNGSIGVNYVWITPPATGASITSFKFTSADNSTIDQDVIGTVNEAAKTITLTVPFSADLDNLIASFTLSSGATAKIGSTVQTSGTTPNSFSSQQVYTVTAADNTTTQNYTVTVNKAAARTGNSVLSFKFLEVDNSSLNEDITASVDTNAMTVTASIPYYATLNDLTATFTLSDGATATISGTPQLSGQTANDYTSPLTWSIRAENGTTQNYTVTVTQIPARTGKAFTAFWLDRSDNWFLPGDISGTIDEPAKTIALSVPYDVNPNSLTASFTVSDGASVTVGGTGQQSGTTQNDFTSPVTYRVTAEDSSYAEYTVTVTVEAALTGNSFTDFRFTAADNSALDSDAVGVIDAGAKTVAVTVPWGVDLTSLTASFSNSAGSTVKIGSTDQVSGSTVNNFSSALTYTITAQDSTPVDWQVTVTNADQIMVTSISVDPASQTLVAGHTNYVSADISPSDASVKQIVWSSSDTNIVTVDPASGLVTAVGQGTATVTATAQDGSTVTGSATVTVPAPNYASELIISEYVEGSHNNKYIEIYNGTGSPVDLSGYSLELHSSAAAAATSTNQLSGQLAHGAVYIVANSSAALSGNFTVGLSTGSVCNFNGDDSVVLRRISDNAVIDMVGTIDGVDPGSVWLSSDTSYSTAEFTLVRKPIVKSGFIGGDFVTGSLDNQWIAYPQNYANNLGIHAMYFD